MQTPQRRRYYIDLNGPAARNNLRLLTVLYPLWGIIMPFYEVFPNYDPMLHTYNSPILPTLLVFYVALVAFASSIVTNRLVISAKTIRFGHNFLSSRKTGDLKALTLEKSPITNEKTVLRFSFDDSGKEQDTIETAGMESRMKARLLTAVDNFSSKCHVPKDVRSLATTEAKVKIKKDGANVILTYHSRLLMQQIAEAIALYEQFFWRVWTAFFALVTVIAAPWFIYFLYMQLSQNLFHKAPEMNNDPLINWWSSLWGFLVPLGASASTTAAAVGTLSSLPRVAGLLCIVALGAAALFGVYMARPNRLKITPDGLQLEVLYFNSIWHTKSIPWVLIKAIEIEKSNSSSPIAWKIVLRTKDGGDTVKLVLGALGSNAQKQELLKAIEQYAADIPVDAEVLSALAPPSENSYTELWLASLASAPQRERLTPLNPGHTLKDGTYIVDARHGAGGQGVTYLARRQQPLAVESIDGDDSHLDLVIKETILPVYVDSENRRQSVEHFERDARLLAKLDHPSLVKLCDYFIEDHRAYLVLDRIHGQNLRQLVEAQGRLAPSVVLKMAKKMCAILSYLHGQDPEVIHRDFTPENLMLDLNDELKLIDFGVAHEFKSRTTATVVGKHAYLPPEQLRGKPSTQSDMYAMAATLTFLLTGEDPMPLSRLNPFVDVIATSRVAQDPQEQKCLSVLSRAIESASELNTAERVAGAEAMLDLLDDGAVIQVSVKIEGLERVDG